MSLREFLFENLAGGLEYHPRRAALYIVLAVAAAAIWIFCPTEAKFTTSPLVFALGASHSSPKASFSFAVPPRASDSTKAISPLCLIPRTANNGHPLPALAAQVLQDFGAGSLLLWPLLNIGQDIDQSWSDPPRLHVFATGTVLVALGWAIRRPTAAN